MCTLGPPEPPAAFIAVACSLLPPQAQVIVAVSGGPDSQALLDMLAVLRGRLKLKNLWAIGIDHQLRREAPHELAIAARLAAQHGINFQSIAVCVAPHGNLLAAARRARYAALHAAADQLGATHIATGHTLTDQVETLLLHLCRGTGLAGAGGMRTKRGRLVRPLLCLSRPQVMAWVQARHLQFAQDPTNGDLRRARAVLRTHVLPGLAQINPKFAEHMGSFCADAQQEAAWLTRQATRLLHRLRDAHNSLDIPQLRQLSLLWLQRVLLLWLRHMQVTANRRSMAALVRLCTTWAPGGPAGLSIGGIDVTIDRGRLWPSQPAMPPTEQWPSIAEDKRVPLGPDRHLTIRYTNSRPEGQPGGFTLASVQRAHHSSQQPAQTVAFDADHLHFELSLRPWKQGDKLHPFGLKGHIKVGDLFTNHKVAQVLRKKWPLLMCGEQILWVIGLRRSVHAPVTAATRRIVTLKVESNCPQAQGQQALSNTEALHE